MLPTPADIETRREAISDLASGMIFLILAAGLAIVHFSQGGRLHADFGAEPGPAVLPQILLAILGIAGVLLMLRGGLAIRKRVDLTAAHQTPKDDLVAVLVALVLLVAFQPLRNFIGAAPALCVLGAGLGLLAGYREGVSFLRVAIEGVMLALVLFAIFRFVLSVPIR